MGLPKNATIHLTSKLPPGRLNNICDVDGVKVGHKTIRGQGVNTGVTVVLPHAGNLFQNKVMAGVSVINGFGKSIGLLQLMELGTIETPIVMTNTLSVGTAFTALTKHMLSQNPDIGITTGTVNCLITECNDGRLNDIRSLNITEQDVFDAIDDALRSDKNMPLAEGAVGSGTGMCCLGLKGGIGSASRLFNVDGKEYALGCLVMSNFGAPGNLMIDGKRYDTSKAISKSLALPEDSKLPEDFKDKGSIIMILATDLPLSERQLNRVAKRTTIALGRVGSYLGNGSGDIAIAFTTANQVPHYSNDGILNYRMIFDDKLDTIFQAAIEATEEAIISSLYHAQTTEGFRNKKSIGLQDFLKGETNY